MFDALSRRVSQAGYDRARLLLLSTGFTVLAIVAIATYLRRVETAEVVATLLFIPVFLGVTFGRVRGGLAMAAVASVVYVAFRFPAIEAVGWGEFTTLIASRTLAYTVFGLVGGWADGSLEKSLHKLELYDVIEDATGLNNAWYFVEATREEMARADTHDTVFSIALYKFNARAFKSVKRRQLVALLRDLGRALMREKRPVDHIVFATDQRWHYLAAIVPHTGALGAEMFRERFADQVSQFLTSRGASLDEAEVTSSALTYPQDSDAVQALRSEFHHLDEFEHGHVHDDLWEEPATA